MSRVERTLAILRFKAITRRAQRGNPVWALSVKVPVTQILEVNLQAKPVLNFQSESLILAQNERWRQA
jgi:hypothetical protein